MGDDIQKISLEVDGKASGATKGIRELTGQLKDLDRSVKPAAKDLMNLSRSMDSLRSSTQKFNRTNFSKISSDLRGFSSGLNNINTSVRGFSSMGSQLKDMSSGLNAMRRSFESLSRVAPNLNKINLSKFTTELGKLTSLGKISESFVQMKEGGRAFSTGINAMNKSADKLPELIKKINSLDLKDFRIQVKDLSEALKVLAGSIEGVNTASRGMVNNVTKLPTTVNKMNKAVAAKNNSVNNMFFGSSTNILSTFYLFKELANVMGYPMRKANDFIETMNLFNVVMGESNIKAAEFITNLESIGVDWEQAMRFQSSFYDIGKSLGVTAKNAYTLSEQFTKLAYDYASLYNLPVELSFQKLQAALVGTVEPIRRLGKDVSIAKLEEIALSLGIDKSVRSMNQAERAELRFIAVMQQSSSALNDMERTINQPANAIRVLKAQFTSLAREIGSLFIPMLTNVLPYLIAIVKLLREIVQTVMGFFGVKLFDLDFKDVSQPLGAINTETEDIADNFDRTTKAAKKLKDYLLGIDELNVLSKDTGADNPSGGRSPSANTGGLDTGGLGLDLEKFGYEEVLKGISSKADEIYQKFRKWKKPLMVAAGILATLWGIGKIMKFINALKGIGTASTLAMGIRGLGGLAKSFFALAGGSGVIAKVAGAFVGLGKTVLGAMGIVTGSATIAGLTGLALVMAGLAAAVAGVKYATQPAVKQMDEFKNVSMETKDKLKPVIDTWKELQDNLDKIDWTDKIISQKDVEDNVSKVREMVGKVVDEVSSDKNEELKNLELLKDMKVISQETYQKRKKELERYYNGLEKSTEDAEAKIKKILQGAKKDKRKLTEGEVKELDKLYKQIRDNAVNTMSESEKDQMIIMSRLKHNSVALTVESGSKILKEAKKNKDKQIEEAKATREEMINQLELRFATDNTMTEEQYQKELKDINTLYDKQVKKAEKGYADINKKVKKGMGDEYKYINEKNGEIKTKWTVFWQELPNIVKNHLKKTKEEVVDKLTKLKDNITSIDDKIKEKWSKTWSNIKEVGSQFAEAIKTKVGTKFKEIKEKVFTRVNQIKEKWKKGWTSLKTIAEEKGEALKTKVGEKLKDIKTKFTDKIKEIKDKWKDMWDWLKDHEPEEPKRGGKNGNNPDKGTPSSDGGKNKASVTGLAHGGFAPDTSFISPQNLWTAGEAGREVIGSYRSRTTVMPLEDTGFVQSMYRAVKEGVVEAMNSSPIAVNVTTKAELDGQQIYENQEQHKYNMGSPLVTVL